MQQEEQSMLEGVEESVSELGGKESWRRSLQWFEF